MAASVQALTYLLSIVAIASGWLVVSAASLPVPTRVFGLITIPNVAAPDPALFAAARLAHRIAAWSILGLVALHVAGALKHHWIDRDDVLLRMLPRRRKPSGRRLGRWASAGAASFTPTAGSPHERFDPQDKGACGPRRESAGPR